MSSNTNTINCLIIDDEPLAQEVLATHIAQVATLTLVQQCNNAMEAFEALHKNKIDLIFLDINMPVISGLNFLRSLKEPPAVILTTAYTEYAIEGYELDVVDYLLKPIPFDRFAKAVNKVISLLEKQGRPIATIQDIAIVNNKNTSPTTGIQKDYFFIKSDGKLVKLNYTDVKYIEGMKDYLKVHVANNYYVVHQTMKSMEDQLPADKFMRIHKSYIVALSAIKSIDGNIIHIDKDTIPLGSSYKDTLMKVI
jgi:DNA-binding LytR/AlgR family response regulator